MCDAYTLAKPPHAKSDVEENIASVISWNTDRLLRPGSPSPVMMPDGSLTSLIWGFRRPFFPCLHLARFSSIGAQPWKLAFERGRCAIPVTTFLEVEDKRGRGRTFEMSCPEGSLLWVAGVWDVEHKRPRRFAMIMVECPVVGQVVQRPAILTESETRAYLAGELHEIAQEEIRLSCLELPGAIRIE